MENIEIKKVSISDLNELSEIGRKTFSETFSAGNSEENIESYLEEKFSVKQLTGELTNNDSSFYFSLIDDRVVGYLKVNFGKAQTELKGDTGAEIERIYVLKEFHGKKVGQFLYDKAIEVAKEANTDYIWLGVWEENPRAINFYKKNGFVEFDKHIFNLGGDLQTDIMMKLTLK